MCCLQHDCSAARVLPTAMCCMPARLTTHVLDSHLKIGFLVSRQERLCRRQLRTCAQRLAPVQRRLGIAQVGFQYCPKFATCLQEDIYAVGRVNNV